MGAAPPSPFSGEGRAVKFENHFSAVNKDFFLYEDIFKPGMRFDKVGAVSDKAIYDFSGKTLIAA